MQFSTKIKQLSKWVKENKNASALLFFGVVGGLLIVTTIAAGPKVSLEAESANGDTYVRTGVDTNSSNGQYLQFSSAAVSGGDTGGGTGDGSGGTGDNGDTGGSDPLPLDEPSALGRYNEPADVVIGPNDDIKAAILQAGEGGIVEITNGTRSSNVYMSAAGAPSGWSVPTVVRAQNPANWREAWRIIAEEDYNISNGQVAESTFAGTWSTALDRFESHMDIPLDVVGFRHNGGVAIRDGTGRLVNFIGGPQMQIYSRDYVSIYEGVNAWPAHMEADRMQVYFGQYKSSGQTVVLQDVMIGNSFKTNGSSAHVDNFQAFGSPKVRVNRVAFLAAANKVQINGLAPNGSWNNVYAESYSKMKGAGGFVPSGSYTTSNNQAMLVDSTNSPSLTDAYIAGILVNVSPLNNVRVDQPFNRPVSPEALVDLTN